MWRLVAPSARRTPISVRRSSTEITITLAMPTPPTRRATAPRPSSSAVSAWSVAARASSASDGRVTCTSFGACGLAVAGSTVRTPSTSSGSVRTYSVDADPSMPNSRAATGKPMIAARSSDGVSSSGSRMPTTVNQRPLTNTQRRPVDAVDPEDAAASAPRTTAG